ncbi:MAG TPA: fumarylacetoacetate hydrolase family protein [Acidobacteriaceae bacterium]|nr:fumarylacetoacetate hydrolase family protein [Acidobacteriaceae bacterium]
MILYRTKHGWVVEQEGRINPVEGSLDELLVRDDLHTYLEGLLKAGATGAGALRREELLAPIGNQEVWAAGVTYLRSRAARMAESKDAGGGDFYDRVYSAERPELFFKCQPHKAVGPGAAVGLRSDANWSVPEPELTLVINPSGEIVGYTIGNDMSSRDIEGQNPLYLPQAKIYNRSCALGPGILVRRGDLPETTRISISIERAGQAAFTGETTVAQMKRKPQELAHYLYLDQTFPHGAFLLTGTGIVPPDSFTLERGDVIRISIDGIGTLENPVA